MSNLHALRPLGQSIWLDYISRDLLDSGDLAALIEAGITGVTSNPTILDQAVSKGRGYDDDMEIMAREGKSAMRIYESLAVADIRRAADALMPIYRDTRGADGFVSLEVDPALSGDADQTVTDARRLYNAIGRPNLMIKVPATPACIPAIARLVAGGVNVNATLIFTLDQYQAVAQAYIEGLEQLAARTNDLSGVASVASVFVSRIDTALDHDLAAKGAADLAGRIALANAKAVYAEFGRLFSGPRWDALAAKGGRVQRPLWASTGTKNPAYPDTLYVDGLIGPDTVNTIPPATLKAFMDHGQAARTVDADVDAALAALDRLPGLGIDLKALGAKLQADGLTAFAKSFDNLLRNIREKRNRATRALAAPRYVLGNLQPAVEATLCAYRDQKIMNRMWAHDHTIWKPEPTEITNRLGWLHTVSAMSAAVPRMQAFTARLLEEGFTHALLLGMGGSSLAPEVFSKIFGGENPGLEVNVLDSTDPGRVLHFARNLDPARTLYIVSTKSGGTVETFSFCKYFLNLVTDKLGAAEAGRHFIVITDPGSALEKLAQEFAFRDIFLNDPNIGGRFSVLSFFGMLPAALTGLDLDRLLLRASARLANCDAPDQSPRCSGLGDNSGAYLGVVMGEAAKAGRDKLTFIASPTIAPFVSWAEQLIAESSGKEGQGILPIDNEEILPPEAYAPDRLFIHLRRSGDASLDARCAALESHGHPVVRIHLDDPYDLGGEFVRFEIATAIACAVLGVNPFDQPNVESAKVSARAMVAAYQKDGRLPALTPACAAAGLTAYGDTPGKTPLDALRNFIAKARPGVSYIALQAYIEPNPQVETGLQTLRSAILKATRAATTAGYGPRFLHSTGQLHKGDGGHGLFIQFTAAQPQDTPIPDAPGQPGSAMTFGTLIQAQALGDREALLQNGRPVLRLDLGADPVTALHFLAKGL